MRTLIISAAMLATLAVPAAAETRYDRKLEQAVLAIVARTMTGELRGGFSYRSQPALVVAQDSSGGGVTSIEMARILAATIGHGPLMSQHKRTISRFITF
jgi:hypothetical protein